MKKEVWEGEKRKRKKRRGEFSIGVDFKCITMNASRLATTSVALPFPINQHISSLTFLPSHIVGTVVAGHYVLALSISHRVMCCPWYLPIQLL